MTHNHTCEIAQNDECDCECKGAFHGIAKQMTLEQFNAIEEDMKDRRYGEQSVVVKVMEAFKA